MRSRKQRDMESLLCRARRPRRRSRRTSRCASGCARSACRAGRRARCATPCPRNAAAAAGRAHAAPLARERLAQRAGTGDAAGGHRKGRAAARPGSAGLRRIVAQLSHARNPDRQRRRRQGAAASTKSLPYASTIASKSVSASSAGTALPASLRAQHIVGDEARDRGGQRLDVARFVEQAVDVFAHLLADAEYGRRHDRQSPGHRLEDHARVAFDPRRAHEHVGGEEVACDVAGLGNDSSTRARRSSGSLPTSVCSARW